jgi:hypothetical protein
MQSEFYKKTRFMLLALIFIPPLGIFLMWKYKKLNGISRILVSVVLGFCFFILQVLYYKKLKI